MRRKTLSTADILVIGGGHAGLSLAVALGAAGFDVVCLERGMPKARRHKSFDGRTLALSYRSMQVFKKAGLEAAITRAACPILDIRVADQDAPFYLDFDHKEVGDAPFGWIIENALFDQALQDRITCMKNVHVLHGAVIKTMERDDVSARVELDDGRIFEAALVAGAEGRHSFSRTQAGIETYGWDYGQTAIVCTIRHEKPHHNVAVEHFLPGGPFATLPMTQKRSSIVWTEKTAAADALLAMSEADFTDRLEEKVRDYLGAIELIGPRFSHPLSLQHAKSYTAQRLVLIGDAAHGIHPIAGQGFNLGMGDIAVLIEELGRAAGLGMDLGDASLLDRFARRRAFDNGNMVLATDLLDRLFSNALLPVQMARRFGLGMVERMPPLRRFFMRTAMGGVKARSAA